jgi:hypothetical protein
MHGHVLLVYNNNNNNNKEAKFQDFFRPSIFLVRLPLTTGQ